MMLQRIEESEKFWKVDRAEIEAAVQNRWLLKSVDGEILANTSHLHLKNYLIENGITIGKLPPRKKRVPGYKPILKINGLKIYEKVGASELELRKYILLTMDYRFYAHYDTLDEAKCACYKEGRYSVRRRHGKKATYIRIGIDETIASEIIALANVNPDNAGIVYVANMVQNHCASAGIKLEITLSSDALYAKSAL